jgi:hypothetical protein
MSDDTSRRGPRDAARINVHEPHELRYWSAKLGVTPEKLKDLVSQLGPMVSDIEPAARLEHDRPTDS